MLKEDNGLADLVFRRLKSALMQQKRLALTHSVILRLIKGQYRSSCWFLEPILG